jgi:multidrug efflux pump subunit AcrA (membrane-fusion protein)
MNRNYFALALITLVLIACNYTDLAGNRETKPVAQVKITHVSQKNMQEKIMLTATSVYLQRSQVNAPIAGYIIQVHVKYGDAVTRGQVLYEMETKERHALGNNTIIEDTTLKNFGKVVIKASSSGIITTIYRQQTGEYVMEGNQLCTITKSNDLAFQLNVPFEYHALVERNSYCTIVLPDKSMLQGRIVKALSSLNATAQTQMYLVNPGANVFLPEGLVASVLLTTRSKSNTQVLPVQAVLSDELMKSFWIMKLLNDTTAVRVDVKVGIRNNSEVEIVSPKLDAAGRILTEGNYGLADTASVKIIK